MQTVWFQHLKTEQERDDFKALLYNSASVTNRLRELLEARERTMDVFEGTIDEYDTPSWAFKQAHANGRKAELKLIKQLLDLKEIENNNV